MIHHMPMPHRQVVAARVAAPTSPETQVLMMKGVAGMYEKKSRERRDVVSAMMTSTSSNSEV